MMVERVIRSLRYVLRRMMEVRGTKNWPDLLQECVDVMNSRKHKSIGMRPKDVNYSNAGQIFSRLYPYLARDLQPVQHLKPHFKLGQKVRVFDRAQTRGFSKGDLAKGSSEVYIIGRILFGPTICYSLIDPSTGEHIAGKYQSQELLSVQ